LVLSGIEARDEWRGAARKRHDLHPLHRLTGTSQAALRYNPMKWDQKFKPIALRDGRTIASLGEGRSLISALPDTHPASFHWRYASELLLKAAERGERYAVMDARAQIARALKTEGLL
jgi:hypothetical protein